MAKKPNREVVKKEFQTNGWDALNNFTDHVFELVKSGYANGVILIFFLFCCVLIIYKLPPEMLNQDLKGIFRFLNSEKLYIFPLSFLLFFLLYWCMKQRTEYKREIKRLTDTRSKLVHGIQKGELHPLKEHTICSFDFDKEG